MPKATINKIQYVRLGKDNALDWDYVLIEDITFELEHPKFLPKFEFKNEWFHIYVVGSKAFATVSKNYAWDGPTCVADVKGTIVASLIHDAIYQFAEAIMEAWKLSLIKVLGFADNAFMEVMKQEETNIAITYLYFAGVRVFGYPFHFIVRIFKKKTT